MTARLTTLTNGLRIVTEHMPGLQSASIGIWVTAGGRHETPAQNGIAHFLEHMAFKGTGRRNALQIAEAIEDVGGYINAYTSREVTAYYARVLGQDVPLALDVLVDIVTNPAFDPREIEVERGVILQEIGQSLDTPDDVIFDWLQEVAYPDQAMGRTILGPTERVGAFGDADFRSFTAAHYTPDRMILSAAGAVDHDALVADVSARYGAGVAASGFNPEASRFVGGERHEIKELEQAHVTLAFEAPSVMDPAFHTGQIYASVLGGGMSSRLFQELREVRGLCYTVYAQASAYSDTGSLTLYAGTGGEQVKGLVEVAVDEMKRAADDISDHEVTRARVQMKAGMLMGLESPSSRAERMARMVQIWGRVPDLDETTARIDAVTLADVQGFAERMAVSAKTAMALYGPVADAPRLDDLQARRAA